MKGYRADRVIMDEATRILPNLTPVKNAQYGIQFHDGSVLHPWNGRTELMRARNYLEYLEYTYPNDSFVLVTRDGSDKPWREFNGT